MAFPYNFRRFFKYFLKFVCYIPILAIFALWNNESIIINATP